MRILVACEYSGVVRDAFARRGHDAWSCDLLPTESLGQHIQGDVLSVLGDGWDMMIAHPPCTYLSYVGTRHWNEPGRCKKRLDALDFFRQLWEAPIEKICIENPMGCASPTIAKFSQEIHPWYFGDPHKKRTWLWLKNLPPLQYEIEDTLFGPRTATDEPEPVYICQGPKCKGKKISFVEAMRGVKDRAHERSRFWPGISNAMAEQWG